MVWNWKHPWQNDHQLTVLSGAPCQYCWVFHHHDPSNQEISKSLPLAILLLGQKSGVPPKKMPPPKKSKKLAFYPLQIATWTHTFAKPPRTSGTGGIGSHFSLNTPWGEGDSTKMPPGFLVGCTARLHPHILHHFFSKKVICLSCSNQEKTIY